MNKILTTLLVLATVAGMVIPAMANPQNPVADARNAKDLGVTVDGALTAASTVTQEQNINGDVYNWALGVGTGGNVNAQSTAVGVATAGDPDSIVNCGGGAGTGTGTGAGTATGTGTGNTGAGTGTGTANNNGGVGGAGGSDNLASDGINEAGNGGDSDAAGDAAGAGSAEGSGVGAATATGTGVGTGIGGDGGDCSNTAMTEVSSGDVAAIGGSPEGFSGDVAQENEITQDATAVITTSQSLTQPVSIVDVQAALAIDPAMQHYVDSMLTEDLTSTPTTIIS
ncbi:Uncharacterised protein [uncultured archaeon]|nr:Uncharacterised protein [uncultured archaeon]